MSFIEWMDELMPEMEFVAPKRIESICLSCENAAEAGGYALTAGRSAL